MKTLLAPFIQSATGSIDKITAATNRNQPYFKEKQSARIVQGQPWKRTVQAKLKKVATFWASLTDAERLSWQILADNNNNKSLRHVNSLDLGDIGTVVWGAYAYYSHCNMNLQLFANFSINLAPNNINIPVNFSPLLSIQFAAGKMILTVNGNIILANNYLLVYFTAPLSAGNQIRRNKLKFYKTFNNLSPVTVDIAADYTAKFGFPSVGKKVGIGFQMLDITTGFKSSFNIIAAISV